MNDIETVVTDYRTRGKIDRCKKRRLIRHRIHTPLVNPLREGGIDRWTDFKKCSFRERGRTIYFSGKSNALVARDNLIKDDIVSTQLQCARIIGRRIGPFQPQSVSVYGCERCLFPLVPSISCVNFEMSRISKASKTPLTSPGSNGRLILFL